MSAKKTVRKCKTVSTTGRTENNGQIGYLAKLDLLHRDHELPIRSLNACQIRRKNADPATVAKYRELLSESEPPNIIVRYASSPGRPEAPSVIRSQKPCSRPPRCSGPARTWPARAFPTAGCFGSGRASRPV